MNARIADNDAASDFEHTPRIRIDHQIEVALAIANLDIAQAVPFFRQRQEALGEEVHARGPDRQLVGLSAEQPPFDADPVAEIEQLEQLEVQFRHRVLPDVDLQSRQAVGEDEEVRLSERANR